MLHRFVHLENHVFRLAGYVSNVFKSTNVRHTWSNTYICMDYHMSLIKYNHIFFLLHYFFSHFLESLNNLSTFPASFSSSFYLPANLLLSTTMFLAFLPSPWQPLPRKTLEWFWLLGWNQLHSWEPVRTHLPSIPLPTRFPFSWLLAALISLPGLGFCQ